MRKMRFKYSRWLVLGHIKQQSWDSNQEWPFVPLSDCKYQFSLKPNPEGKLILTNSLFFYSVLSYPCIILYSCFSHIYWLSLHVSTSSPVFSGFSFLFFLLFLAVPRGLRDLSSPPGIEPGPRQWKPGILTTGPPGSSLDFLLDHCGCVKKKSHPQSFAQVLILHFCLLDIIFAWVCHIWGIFLAYCSGLGCSLHLSAVAFTVSVNLRPCSAG